MADKLIDRIQELQMNIEKEKDDELTGLLMSLVASMENEDSKSIREKADYNLAILTWLCLKVELECQALRDGNNELEDAFRADIDEVFDYVQKCEYEWELSKEVIADSIDLIANLSTSSWLGTFLWINANLANNSETRYVLISFDGTLIHLAPNEQ